METCRSLLEMMPEGDQAGPPSRKRRVGRRGTESRPEPGASPWGRPPSICPCICPFPLMTDRRDGTLGLCTHLCLFTKGAGNGGPSGVLEGHQPPFGQQRWPGRHCRQHGFNILLAEKQHQRLPEKHRCIRFRPVCWFLLPSSTPPLYVSIV